MGFPLGYTEVFMPKIFLLVLSVLGLVRSLISTLFRSLGLSSFIEPDLVAVSPETQARVPDTTPVLSAVLVQELLPLVKFESLADPPESCAVCLHEFERGEEIRWLRNCRHVFHRGCLDRWMECDQKTCPLCRTRFLPDITHDEFHDHRRSVGEFHEGYALT